MSINAQSINKTTSHSVLWIPMERYCTCMQPVSIVSGQFIYIRRSVGSIGYVTKK